MCTRVRPLFLILFWISQSNVKMKIPKQLSQRDLSFEILFHEIKSPLRKLKQCEFVHAFHVRLSADSGIITDGDGMYSASSKCSWLIVSKR